MGGGTTAHVLKWTRTGGAPRQTVEFEADGSSLGSRFGCGMGWSIEDSTA